jgi:hypothetical protein
MNADKAEVVFSRKMDPVMPIHLADGGLAD